MESDPPREVDRKPKADPDQKGNPADPDKMDPDQTDSGPATATAGKEEEPHYTSTTTTTRRNANGTVSSVYAGNKIRHLKKEDGVPLWRKDIQYDFLRAVFDNDVKVFTKASDGSKGYAFADVYLDAMAKSSKTSKILKDKLLTDKPAAINMAMVCLLVNVGRMNTTLNFFPEMRAQLRTYHSIPSLQAHQDPNAYKQLQDAPRLKSILKGATEDTEQPNTIDEIREKAIPRTNAVNLIFVLAQYAPRISEMHFDVPRDFFDLVMKANLSSASRARAFLWLMWWYLESDFSHEAALNNPFGPGRIGKDAPVIEMPIKCPQFDFLTDEEAALENVDTQFEKEFGEIKRQERLAIINGDVQMYPSSLKRGRRNDGGSPSADSPASIGRSGARKQRASKLGDDNSDSEQSRSPSPVAKGVLRTSTSMKQLENAIDMSRNLPPTPALPEKKKGPGRGNWRRPKDPVRMVTETVFVSLTASNEAGGGLTTKRSRLPTGQQLAAEKARRERVARTLAKGLATARAVARRKMAARERDAGGVLGRAAQRCTEREKSRPDACWDSEEEALTGQGGSRAGAAKMGLFMGGFRQAEAEHPDYGEEAAAIALGLRRLKRRLEKDTEGDVLPPLPLKRKKSVAGAAAGGGGGKHKDMAEYVLNADTDDTAGEPALPKRSRRRYLSRTGRPGDWELMTP